MHKWIKQFSVLFLLLLVNPVDVIAEDLKDVKGPVDFPRSVLWSYIFLIGIVALVIFVLFYISRRKPKGKKQEVKVQAPWEKALQALNMLKAEELLLKEQHGLFYIKLSDIVRHYIEERFDIKAPEMTTEEFLYFVQSRNQLSRAHASALKNFLTACDLVKFAKYAPTGAEAETSFELAVKFVEETKPIVEVSEQGAVKAVKGIE